jgi:hypothetical protein
MKKILIPFFLCVVIPVATFSQVLFQGSARLGTAANKVIISIKPSLAFNATLTGVVFILQVDNTVTQPSISVHSLIPSTFSDAYTFNFINTGGKFNFYMSNTSNSAPATVLTANQELDVLEVTFTGGPPTPTNEVRLAHLADGGPGSLYQFYVEAGSDATNYNNMFYGANAVQGSVSNGYSSYNYVPVLNVALPVNWLGFNVVRSNDDASIDWRVTNEYRNREYELERSTDGKSFTGIGNITAKNNQAAINDYSFIDKNITNLGTSIVYYRLKQTDVDNKFTYSEVRILKLDKLRGGISIFPNPVRDGFYVRISTPLASNTKVGLKLMNQLGQVLDAREISSGVASNYYFDIKKSANIIAGQYNLQVITDGNLLESKKIIVADR